MFEGRIGIDVGGTFVDIIHADATGRLTEVKVPADPADLVQCVVDGLQQLAAEAGAPIERLMAQVPLIVHGTTITTNAVLERRGSRAGILTTEGLRDALQMRKSKKEEPYNLQYQAPAPVIPRDLRLGVKERLDWKGDILIPIDEASVAAAIDVLRERGVESVAVCYLHSYVNDTHERLTMRLLDKQLPEIYSLSSAETLPLVGFYDRISTVSLAAYVGPALRRYLSNLGGALSGLGFKGSILIMKSDGGVISIRGAERNPAVTLLSGPAGGPRAALHYLQPLEMDRCIIMDMGGTSFDTSLIEGGQPMISQTGDIDRLRIALPMLSIHTIGAGGGSIAWFDKANLLHMGPRSAGAVPGPACYSAGGELPTATDADLVLGYINPDYFLGGKIKLSRERAESQIEQQVAIQLARDTRGAAAAMFKIINVNMAAAIGEVSVARGHDPRGFPLVVAGGAGPIHAAPIAEEIGITKVIIPRSSSVLCATGMLFSDLTHEYVRSVWRPGAKNADDAFKLAFEGMIADAVRDLASEGIPEDRIDWHHFADMRYVSQFHQVKVPLETHELADGVIAPSVIERFEKMHDQMFGHTVPNARVEVVHLRTTAVGRTIQPDFIETVFSEAHAKPVGIRSAYLPSRDAYADVPVYRELPASKGNGSGYPGPLLIDRPSTTIFVPDSWSVAVDAFGSYVLSRSES
jgi:N-methylhydantoinase A